MVLDSLMSQHMLGLVFFWKIQETSWQKGWTLSIKGKRILLRVKDRKLMFLFGEYVYVDFLEGLDLPHTWRFGYTEDSRKTNLNIFQFHNDHQNKSTGGRGERRAKSHHSGISGVCSMIRVAQVVVGVGKSTKVRNIGQSTHWKWSHQK